MKLTKCKLSTVASRLGQASATNSEFAQFLFDFNELIAVLCVSFIGDGEIHIWQIKLVMTRDNMCGFIVILHFRHVAIKKQTFPT